MRLLGNAVPDMKSAIEGLGATLSLSQEAVSANIPNAVLCHSHLRVLSPQIYPTRCSWHFLSVLLLHELFNGIGRDGMKESFFPPHRLIVTLTYPKV